MLRWQAVWAVALALALALAASTTAAPSLTVEHAAAAAPMESGWVIVDEPDAADGSGAAGTGRPPLARLTPQAVERVALADRGIAEAQRMRPGSQLRLRFVGQERSWMAELRDRGTRTVLAAVEVDDRTGKVVGRRALPVGDYPSRSSEREVIDAAVADRRLERAARAWGGVEELRARGRIEGCCWEVDFFAPDRTDGAPEDPVIRAEVVDASRQVTGVWTGHAIHWQMARGSRESFGGTASRPSVWIAFMGLFALVMIEWRRLRSLPNIDIAAVLALGISHEAFQRGAIEWSVPLAVPPLLWLAARMGWLFTRGVPRAAPGPEWPAWAQRIGVRRPATVLLVLLCVCLAGLRTGLAWYGGSSIDVGYASVAGARLELEGRAPWGNMPEDVSRGDTYGPANYLAYVPATVLIDDPDMHSFHWGVPAAAATSIAADLGCALLLAWLGVRWLSRRAGALLALGWLTCPWTIWAAGAGTNDGVVAFFALAAFAAVRVAWARGLLVGIATMTKFAPLVMLAPMLHVGSRSRLRQALATTGGFAVATVASLAWVAWRMEGPAIDDVRRFAERTVGFQSDRGSPFSVWGMYGWDTAQRIAQVFAALLVGIACLRPKVRDAWQVAAGIAALLIIAQLVVTHWTYLYVPWFMPFLLLVVIAQRERPAA